MAYTHRAQFKGGWLSGGTKEEHPNPFGASWWQTEPSLGRMAHGVARRAHKLRAIGNGQVPPVVKLAWRILNGQITKD